MSEKKSGSALWTLQEFCTVAGQPWYALQEHNDGGVVRQYTGYCHEMKALAGRLGVVPEELGPIDEQEFFRRHANEAEYDEPIWIQ